MNLMNLFGGCGLLLLVCGEKRANQLTKQIDTPPFPAFKVHQVHGNEEMTEILLIKISLTSKNHELMNLLNLVYPAVIIIDFFLALRVISMNFVFLISSFNVHGFFRMFIPVYFVQVGR